MIVAVFINLFEAEDEWSHKEATKALQNVASDRHSREFRLKTPN